MVCVFVRVLYVPVNPPYTFNNWHGTQFPAGYTPLCDYTDNAATNLADGQSSVD